MENFLQANLFELSSGDIHITYSTTSILGGPLLSYRDHELNRSFRGAEIRINDTEIGQQVTVTVETIPELRKVDFALILPMVTVMSQSTGTRIKIPGIRIVSPTTFAGPLPGPQKLYSMFNMRGTAQFVVS